MEPSNLESITVTAPLSRIAVEAARRGRQGDYSLALLVHHRSGAEVVPLALDTPIVLGRDVPSQVRIPDVSLSREHACFTLSGGVVIVEDLRSTNGTWVSGNRVMRAQLTPGDEVVLGRVVVCVRMLAPENNVLPGITSHEQLRVALEKEVARARYFGRGLAVLLVRNPKTGGHAGQWYPRVRALLRPVDHMALHSADAAAVLLPEAGMDAALELARAICQPQADEPPLFVGVATFPDAALTAEELLEVGWSAVQRATPERPVIAAPSGTWTRSDAPERKGAEPVVASPAMRGIFAAVARLARSAIPVLLQGETGTGKEVVARALHDQSARRSRPMVCVNCGAIPQQLVESTLFGHERGAFTGAGHQQKGVFEAADGGTVFLDEIGELPVAAQVALLRVLETQRVTRVGSIREIEVDIRLVAATHRDIDAMCETGAFRRDLLYRLNTMTLTIPPLRTRSEEIEPLALHFLEAANASNGRCIRAIDPGALALLRSYAWPGNVRELRNAIERAVVIADGDRITEHDLPERVMVASQPVAPARGACPDAGAASLDAGGDLRSRLQRYEIELILEAMREAEWNQTEAARRLGMPLRTLVHKLKALGIRKLGYAPANSS